MGVKLVALDIDGTLVAPGANEPSPAVRRAVERLAERGIAVILASGRMFPGTILMARTLGLATPVICQQGCSVHLPDGTMTHEFPLAHDLALDIIGHAREIRRAYEWFSPLRYIASAESEATREYGRVSGIVPEYRPDPELSGLAPTGVGIISTAAEANGIHRHLVATYPDELHVLDFPTVTVAVHPDANKGHSLSLICADLGIDRHEVVAFGDSTNDAAMLAWAGRGYGMAHSDLYARDAADELLDDVPDALAQALERL